MNSKRSIKLSERRDSRRRKAALARSRRKAMKAALR